MARQRTIEQITPMPSIRVDGTLISKYKVNTSKLAPSLQAAHNGMVARAARNGPLLVNGKDILERPDIVAELRKGNEYFRLDTVTGRVETMLDRCESERTPAKEILHIYATGVLSAAEWGWPLVLGYETDTRKSPDSGSGSSERNLFLDSSNRNIQEMYNVVLIGIDYSETGHSNPLSRMLRGIFHA
jgi:hypothetical protein